MAIAFTDILEARRRIAGRVLRTPMRRSPGLERIAGTPVLLKCEHHQTTGSFKLRGATNAVLSLTEEEHSRGVVTFSTGNHGRALSHAAIAAGTRAVVCMSALVPSNKVEAIRALGADIRIVGKSQDEAERAASELEKTEGLRRVSPMDDAAVIAGQGTLGMEVMEDAPELETVLVPLSGGGLISGVALAVKTLSPQTRIIGVGSKSCPAMAASLEAGRPVEVPEEPSLADSLGGGIGLENRHTFDMTKRYVDECVLVGEDDIAAGIRFAYEAEGEVIEGAAAVGIAALLNGSVKLSGPTAIILSGKNIAPDLHRCVINGETPRA
ncbi:hydroxyectoine utilization dehydratase EutB [Mesorhizobium koreense]|uniref:hydroxyectoine utilization dehydratase EutB n=1 Tax=Mesorhizobium koreense TaxID=3074855 RepID=UPI00287B7446|nr:hydroxyectoine utilization dehydratase EutB [Mesorhizobium sp. WR6]